MYARRAGDRELTFDFGAGLVNDNLLVVDRETSSVWSQLQGKAISGPLQDSPLQIVPAIQSTWKFWRQEHPATRVLRVEGSPGRPYFYVNVNRPGGGPRPKQRPRHHDTAALGLGVSIGGRSLFLPFRALDQAANPLAVTLGDQALTVHYRKEALTAWATDAAGTLLPAVLAYRRGWMAFHPDSEVWGEP